MFLKIHFLIAALSIALIVKSQDTENSGGGAANRQDSVEAMPEGNYDAGRFRKKLLGENYRKSWETPVKAPIFNPKGFEIVGRGDGSSAKSLVLEKEDGRLYLLWSVAKDPQKTMPEEFREVLSAGLMADLSTAAHPYGALIIPPLARAAGIFYTNPRLVYVPDDPWLGKYGEYFAHTLAFLEEKPEGSQWRESKSFGFPEIVHNDCTAVENLISDHDFQVDQRFVIRNRLFDMLIGDWDRHDKQWMWALFSRNDERIYQPIPLNRDQAFFTAEGLLPKLVARKWAVPKFQGFRADIKWAGALMHNARYFDRFFITEPSARDWLEEAYRLQRDLTDAAIENAVSKWPENIFELDGERIAGILKARRDRLHEYALDYYLSLAQIVSVRGSDKRERFEVKRIDDKETEAAVYKLRPDGSYGDLIYKRIFITGQTKEIRLYGFGGDDEFHVEGKVDEGLRVRIIGGEGRDLIADSSRTTGLSRKTIVYDKKSDNNILIPGPETKNRISNLPNVNNYNRKDYKTDKFYPIALADYNSYDGVFIGVGAYINTFGFRKEPFSTRQLFTAVFAPSIGTWNIDYSGEFNHIAGRTGLQIKGDLRLPYSTNFFGMGNESQNRSAAAMEQVDRSYYRIRYQYIKTSTLLKWDFGKTAKLMAGPSFTAYRLLKPSSERSFFKDLTNDSFEGDFSLSPRNYAGAQLDFSIDSRNNPLFPSKGVYWIINSEFMKGLNHGLNDLGKISTEISLYMGIDTNIPLTIGNRIGAEFTIGDYTFLNAAKLGENSNLRGFRRDRFAGRNYFFNNTELRLTLFKRFIIPGSLGILTFCDIGRVWENGEDSKIIHVGYGGGLWFAPLNKIVGSLSFGFSNEETFQTNLSLGYSF